MSLSLPCSHRTIMAASKIALIRAEIAFAKLIRLYEMAKIRTTITVKGVVHPFGTCMEGFVGLQRFEHCYAGHTSPNPACPKHLNLKAEDLRMYEGRCDWCQ